MRFYERWMTRLGTPIRKLPNNHMGYDCGFQWSPAMESPRVQRRVFHRRAWLNKPCAAYAPIARLAMQRDAKRRDWF